MNLSIAQLLSLDHLNLWEEATDHTLNLTAPDGFLLPCSDTQGTIRSDLLEPVATTVFMQPHFDAMPRAL